jgi:hypothetical protein
MDHYVTRGTVLEFDRREIVEVGGTGCSDREGTYAAVAFETKLGHIAASKKARIVRPMGEMANDTTFLFYRRVLEYEGPLFVNVALHANCVDPRRETGLLQLESSMRIMTITTLHSPFGNSMMIWLRELGLCFVVAILAELGFCNEQKMLRSYSGTIRWYRRQVPL